MKRSYIARLAVVAKGDGKAIPSRPHLLQKLAFISSTGNKGEKLRGGIRFLSFALFAWAITASPQEANTLTPTAIVQVAPVAEAQVPRLIRFSGTLMDTTGKPLSGVAGVTFLLYKDQTGGAPLWMETQNVSLDAKGHYTVLLGSSKSDGLPMDVFASGEARWLGVQVESESEQPRVLLLSVPYALKAADAETLAGKPASAFLLAGTDSGPRDTSVITSATTGNSPTATPASITGSGTTNRVAKFTSATSIGNSAIFESGGKVGIGNTSPAATLDISGSTFIRGNLNLSQTTSATVGVINMGSSPFIHACCSSSASNSFVGASAGNFTTTGFHDTANGFEALHSNTTGTENTATGYQALFSNANGNSNTADGHQALTSNTSGFNNTATGFSAMLSNGSGHDNTAVGDSVLNFNTTGSFNTAVGETALGSNTTGTFNTAVGYNANVGSGNLTNATAIGAHALVGASNALVLGGTGTNAVNVGIGTATPSATLEVDGSNQLDVFVKAPETGVGAALDLITTGSGGLQWEILNTGAFSAQGPNKLNIRNVNTGNDIFTILANGQIGIETFSPDNTLTVNGSADKPGGGSWGTFSDRRLKTIDGSYQSGLSQILRLTPVRYRYRQGNALGIRDSDEHVGLVAQDVQKVIPEAVSANSQGYLLVNNDPIVWTMLNAIKQLQQQIERQQINKSKLNRELQEARQVQVENVRLRRELARIQTEVRQIRAQIQQQQPQSADVAARTVGH